MNTVFATVLASLILGPTTAPAALRGHDPWVFRCALDQRPRMVVAAVAPGWWIAFDATTGAFHKAWEGEVQFTGTVYDTRHGPQPRSVGEPLFAGEPVRIVGSSQTALPIRWQWRGYRFVDGEVEFLLAGAMPDGRAIGLAISPRVYRSAERPEGIRLVISPTGLRAGEKAILPLVEVNRARVTAGRLRDGEAFQLGQRFELTITEPSTLDLEIDQK